MTEKLAVAVSPEPKPLELYQAKIAAFKQRMAADDDLRVCVEHMQTEAWQANCHRAVCDGCGLDTTGA